MKISQSEWQVMKVIWTKSPITSQEIYQALGTRCKWSTSTVKTLLGRLVSKGAIDANMVGHKNYYLPLLSEKESIHQITQEVVEKTCVMKRGTVIEELITKSDLTAAMLDQLIRHINKKRQVAATSVSCHCLAKNIIGGMEK